MLSVGSKNLNSEIYEIALNLCDCGHCKARHNSHALALKKSFTH